MSDSLTLFNNTLIKLVSRSGTEIERQTITLDVGEFGYTTDSKRLYIGDGITPGGSIVGNVFKGYASNVLTIGGTPRPGDSAFDTSSKTLYLYKSGGTADPTSWQPVGGFYSSGNGTIVIDSSNNISVSSISANNISRDALGGSLTLSAGRVTLSATIAVNEITTASVSSLKLPTNLTLGTQGYKLTATPIPGGVLTTDSQGNLSWVVPASSSTIVPLVSVANTSTGLVSSLSVFNTSIAPPATLTLGNGLTGSYGGVQSSTIPVSGNISISPLFSPTAQVSFSQSGSIIRSVGVASITPVNFSTGTGSYTTDLNNMYKGFAYGTIKSRYPRKPFALERSDVSGFYVLTLNQPLVDITKAVVDVKAVNDVFSYGASSKYEADFFSPTLGYRVLIKNNTTIYISFHSTSINTPDKNRSVFDGFVLTSGDNRNDTRFNVTVYA